MFLVFSVGRILSSGFVTDFRNSFKTSTFSYIVIGFTNIRTLNGSMQHKVLKFSNYFQNILDRVLKYLIMSENRAVRTSP